MHLARVRVRVRVEVKVKVKVRVKVRVRVRKRVRMLRAQLRVVAVLGTRVEQRGKPGGPPRRGQHGEERAVDE